MLLIGSAIIALFSCSVSPPRPRPDPTVSTIYSIGAHARAQMDQESARYLRQVSQLQQRVRRY
jgi:hypothetical protein